MNLKQKEINTGFTAVDIKDYEQVQKIKLGTWITKFSLLTLLIVFLMLFSIIFYYLVSVDFSNVDSNALEKIINIINIITEAIFK